MTTAPVTAAAEEFSTHITTEVVRLMERRGVSSRALAAAVDIPVTTLRRRLGGTTPFSVGELACVAEALEVSAVDLMPKAGA